MASLSYHGPAPAVPTDVAPRKYAADQIPTGLTPEQIDTRISAALVGKVSKSYVDTRDALNANVAYVTAGDSTRVRTAAKEQPNGVLALGPSGRASVNRFNVTTTQRFPKGVWTPTAYNGPVANITAEQTLYPLDIPDPGYPYKVLLFGMVEAAMTSTNTESPLIVVRQGDATTGQIVGSGFGTAEHYQAAGVDFFERTSASTADGLASQDWEQIAMEGSAPLIVCTGHEAALASAAATPTTSILARRANAVDAITPTDHQHVVMQLGGYVQDIGGNPALAASKDVYLRINSNATQYVRFQFVEDRVFMRAATGGAEFPVATGTTMFGPYVNPGNRIRATAGYDGVPNRYHAEVIGTDGSVVGVALDYTDSANALSVGVDNRGWGFGMRGLNIGTGNPRRPSSLAMVGLDPSMIPPPGVPIEITSVSPALQTAITGATTLYVRATRTNDGGSSVFSQVTDFHPGLVAHVVPA